MGLEVFCSGKKIFSSSSKWIYPLFELEDFLKANPVIVPGELEVHDTVQGRAAALLTWRLGIRKVRADLISSLAVDFFKSHDVSYSFINKVPKILCKTEELITDGMDIETAYNLLRNRAYPEH